MQPNQRIEEIKIEDLKLWSENPRDPIQDGMSDFEILSRAVKDDKKKWNLTKLIGEMGAYYDTSELPTVVLRGKRYIVYDGNRRVAIIKYLQHPEWSSEIERSLFPTSEPENLKNMKRIPCNVCDEETALNNIERKHVNSGSWKQLDRDYFEHIHRGKEKSLFLKFEEATGLISQHSFLNENIMKNDILTEGNLEDIGFSFGSDGVLVSMYSGNDAEKILKKIVELKKSGTIGSRGEHKYDMQTPLSNDKTLSLKRFRSKGSAPVIFPKIENPSLPSQRKTKRTKTERPQFFGPSLSLKEGAANDVYRDILDLYEFYKSRRDDLSTTFPNLIRMSLRVLVEAAMGKGGKIDSYIKQNFKEAKKVLTKDERTTLSNYSVSNSKKLIQLLQTGAHQYSSSSNIEQIVAMSIIIGAMLKITHSKEDE
ncbi:MAG: hypothetical protein OXB96_02465 [Candidatus Kaiserbacteria bacterium]|nr:hypothetical protein [Candidatus Kaiserbacteria bacterium]